MPGSVLVFAEQREGQLRKSSFELLSNGRKIADQLGAGFDVLVMGPAAEAAVPAAAEYGPERVFVAEDAALKDYTTDAYATVLANLIKEQQPGAVLLGNTPGGKDVAPRVAERVGAGMISDITGIDIEAGELVFTHPIYAGKAFIKAKSKVQPAIATVRPNALGAGEPVGNKGAQAVKLEVKLDPSSLRQLVKEVVRKAAGRVELTEADIIVSGGRGMKGPENFTILEELADVLGAAVGASRAAVDAGWREVQYQVGQTGKTVSPVLYIACGISGAIQHLAGMGSSKVIVAINKDPEANIFNVADYGIVDDLFKVVPLLKDEFGKLLAD